MNDNEDENCDDCNINTKIIIAMIIGYNNKDDTYEDNYISLISSDNNKDGNDNGNSNSSVDNLMIMMIMIILIMIMLAMIVIIIIIDIMI